MAAAAPIPEKDLKAFKALTEKKYVDQAKWYLNGFWTKGAEKEAENVWKYTQKFQEYDEKKKKNGSSLDEFMAHKFLESLGETLTVIELRAKLRKIDLDADGKMALLEYLAFRYTVTVKQIIDAPQGGTPEDQKEIDAAAALLDQLMTALQDLITKVASTKAAEAELKAAVDALHAQQHAYDSECARLEAKSKDMMFSVVLRNKAAHELAQLKSKDPLPLNKAKLTQGAALKRVEKERKALEAAQADTQQKCDAASAALEKLKAKGGASLGSLWWMEREVTEAQKYLPQSKQTKAAVKK